MKPKRVGDRGPDRKTRTRTPRKLSERKVLKMLAVMESQQPPSSGGTGAAATAPPENSAHTKEFLSSGRTGRRNALPNILGEHAVVSSSDLPGRLQALTTSERTGGGDARDAKDAAGPSGSRS